MRSFRVTCALLYDADWRFRAGYILVLCAVSNLCLWAIISFVGGDWLGGILALLTILGLGTGATWFVLPEEKYDY